MSRLQIFFLAPLIACLNSIGCVYSKPSYEESISEALEANRYADAERIAKRAIKDFEKQPQPSTELSVFLNSLGSVYFAQHKFAEAESQYKRSLAIDGTVIPVPDLLVARHSYDLGNLYYFQSKFALATPLYEKAVELANKSAQATVEEKANYWEKLSDSASEGGESQKAEESLQRAIEMRESQHKADTSPLAKDIYLLARMYAKEGKDSEAESLFRRGIEVSDNASEKLLQALNVYGLAAMCQGRKDIVQANELAHRASVIVESYAGSDLETEGLCFDSLGSLYTLLGDNKKSEYYLKRSVVFMQKAHGAENPSLALALNNLAAVYCRQGKYEQALPMSERALGILELFPDLSSYKADCLKRYAEVLQKLGRKDDAAAASRRYDAIVRSRRN